MVQMGCPMTALGDVLQPRGTADHAHASGPTATPVTERIARRLGVLGQEVRIRLVCALHERGEL